MFRTSLASLVFAIGVALAAPPATAGPGAEALIETTAKKIATGDYRPEEISDLIDTVRVARFTLGRHARTLPSEDVARYVDAFDTAVRRAFSVDAGNTIEARIEVVGSIDRSPTDSIVTTRVHVEGEDPMTVRWRVIERGGTWRVVDIETFGLWLAIEQRAQVNAILDRNGATIDDVITAFNTRLQSPDSSASRRG